MRLRHGEKIDADEIAETFVNNELDNVDAPPALQATTEEIRGLTTSMSIKKAVRCVTPRQFNIDVLGQIKSCSARKAWHLLCMLGVLL